MAREPTVVMHLGVEDITDDEIWRQAVTAYAWKLDCDFALNACSAVDLGEPVAATVVVDPTALALRLLGHPRPARGIRSVSDDGPDLVVAGAGGGLAGALRAAELGLDVLVVEVNEHFAQGNNTAMSTAMVPGAGSRWQREAGIDDGPERFVADIMAKTSR